MQSWSKSFSCSPFIQTVTSLQQTYYLNPRTKWYPALDKSSGMKSAYFTIHLGKKSSSKWLPVDIHCLFRKHQFHILHFPSSTRLSTKPTGRHYTKYRFSPEPDIVSWTQIQASTIGFHENYIKLQYCLRIPQLSGKSPMCKVSSDWLSS